MQINHRGIWRCTQFKKVLHIKKWTTLLRNNIKIKLTHIRTYRFSVKSVFFYMRQVAHSWKPPCWHNMTNCVIQLTDFRVLLIIALYEVNIFVILLSDRSKPNDITINTIYLLKTYYHSNVQQNILITKPTTNNTQNISEIESKNVHGENMGKK